MSLFVVTQAIYNHSTGELNSYVLGKTRTMPKAQLLITEDIKEWQEAWKEEGEVTQFHVSASFKLAHLQIQYEIITF